MASSSPSKSSLPLIIALVACAATFVFCGAGLFFVGSKSQDIQGIFAAQPLKGFGDLKVVGETKEEWDIYEFPDIKMRIAAVDNPRPGYLFTDDTSRTMKGWAYYYVFGAYLECDLWCIDYRRNNGFTEEELIRNHYDLDEKDPLPKIEKRKVGGRTISVINQEEDHKGRTAIYGMVIFSSGKHEVVMDYSYYKRKDRDHAKDLEIILNSVKFLD